MSEPNRVEVTKHIGKLKTDEDVETYLASVLSEVPDEPMNVQQFTNLQEVLYSDGHALTVGRTGYGKTTLLLSLLHQFMERGWKVLYRDDGGLEFGYLAKYHPAQIFIPDGTDISLTLSGFDAAVVQTNDLKRIIEETINNNYPLNVIVFDAYVVNPAVSAKFYSKLFMQLIHKCQQIPKSRKEPLIFSIDELNDLVAPHGRGITGTHESMLGLFEYNVRKLRKHRVRLFATTHRFTQLSINVRSQCDHVFVKKCYGADLWDFMSRALITANNKTFWKVLRKVISMPVDEFIFFDKNGHFDFYRIPDIPRDPCIDVEALGVVEDADDEGHKRVKQSIYERDVKIAVRVAKGLSNKAIAAELGETPNVVAAVKHKLVAQGVFS